MRLRVRLEGFNQLLSELYAEPLRVGMFLARLGFDDDQLDRVKRNHLETVLDQLGATLAETATSGPTDASS